MTTGLLSEMALASVDEVLHRLHTGMDGLNENIQSGTLKTVSPFPGRSLLGRMGQFLRHFREPLILLLILATTISFFIGQVFSASIIFVIVIISVIIDFSQETTAEAAVNRLRSSVRVLVTVVRRGKESDLPAESLRPGDIILLSAGKLIPADCRILTSTDFFVNQSSLTGESVPCEKVGDKLSGSLDKLTDFSNLVFMGSSVVNGYAKAVVIQTGNNTEFGQIAMQLAARKPETDFARGLRRFGTFIMKISVTLVLVIFLINALLHRDILQSFMFSVAVAVGLTPELLPVIMSVGMAKGSLMMAKKGAIVKNLSAIPNFGSMNILCADKTGTLTEDRITLIRCVDGEGAYSGNVFRLAYLNSFFQSGMKNPLDDAILAHGKPEVEGCVKIDELPFDFFRKKMSVIVRCADQLRLICKGAPEEIFKVIQQPADLLKAKIQYEQLSEEGYRVLAIASKPVALQDKYSRNDEDGLVLDGFVAFLDPPRADVAKMIRSLEKMGIQIKIITGDNDKVTRKICRDIGLNVKGVLTGTEIDALTNDALKARIKHTTIFTRFSPVQKNRVIGALKESGAAVGYMGDGINDAPSLRTADVGISVSGATDVAKDAADIILTRKDLTILRDGILEGRKIFANAMKYLRMGLSSNFGNMFSVAAATLFLPFLPMLPAQILINNFLYDTSQMAIPADNVDAAILQSPQQWNLGSIKRFMIVFGLVSSLFDIVTFWLLFQFFSVSESGFRAGWFMESLATQILIVFIIRTHRVPFFRSNPSRRLVFFAGACLLAGWLLPFLPFGWKVGFSPLPLSVIGIITALTCCYLFSAELLKVLLERRHKVRKRSVAGFKKFGQS